MAETVNTRVTLPQMASEPGFPSCIAATEIRVFVLDRGFSSPVHRLLRFGEYGYFPGCTFATDSETQAGFPEIRVHIRLM